MFISLKYKRIIQKSGLLLFFALFLASCQHSIEQKVGTYSSDIGKEVEVKLLILYTPNAKNNNPNIEEKIDKVAQVLQQAMANTQTGVTFDIDKEALSQTEVESAKIDDTGMIPNAKNFTAILHNLSVAGIIQQKEEQHQADLVSLVLDAPAPKKGSVVDGQGDIGGRYSAVNARTLVEEEGKPNEYISMTLAHEIGHNFGLDHDEESLTIPLANLPFNHQGIGFVGLKKEQNIDQRSIIQMILQWQSPWLTAIQKDGLVTQGIYRTIMAYAKNSNCNNLGETRCQVVPYYSTNSAQSNIYLTDNQGGKHRLGDAQHDARNVILHTKKCISQMAETRDYINLKQVSQKLVLYCGNLEIK